MIPFGCTEKMWLFRNKKVTFPNVIEHKRQIMNQVVLLAGNPWAAGSDVDKQQEATQKINHSIIGVIHV